MTYQEQYKQAQSKGKTKQLTVEIWTWDEEGQELIGKVQSIIPFTDGKFDTEVSQYVIETDNGLVSTVLGSATDKQIAGKVREGAIVAILFKGKKELSDKRHVNLFDVVVV